MTDKQPLSLQDVSQEESKQPRRLAPQVNLSRQISSDNLTPKKPEIKKPTIRFTREKILSLRSLDSPILPHMAHLTDIVSEKAKDPVCSVKFEPEDVLKIFNAGNTSKQDQNVNKQRPRNNQNVRNKNDETFGDYDYAIGGSSNDTKRSVDIWDSIGTTSTGFDLSDFAQASLRFRSGVEISRDISGGFGALEGNLEDDVIDSLCREEDDALDAITFDSHTSIHSPLDILTSSTSAVGSSTTSSNFGLELGLGSVNIDNSIFNTNFNSDAFSSSLYSSSFLSGMDPIINFNSNPAPIPIPEPVIPTHLSVNDLNWYYSDPQGNTQGPFSNEDMRRWNNDGFFTSDLPIKLPHWKSFHQFHTVFPGLSGAFESIPSEPQSNKFGMGLDMDIGITSSFRTFQLEPSLSLLSTSSNDLFRYDTPMTFSSPFTSPLSSSIPIPEPIPAAVSIPVPAPVPTPASIPTPAHISQAPTPLPVPSVAPVPSVSPVPTVAPAPSTSSSPAPTAAPIPTSVSTSTVNPSSTIPVSNSSKSDLAKKILKIGSHREKEVAPEPEKKVEVEPKKVEVEPLLEKLPEEKKVSPTKSELETKVEEKPAAVEKPKLSPRGWGNVQPPSTINLVEIQKQQAQTESTPVVSTPVAPSISSPIVSSSHSTSQLKSFLGLKNGSILGTKETVSSGTSVWKAPTVTNTTSMKDIMNEELSQANIQKNSTGTKTSESVPISTQINPNSWAAKARTFASTSDTGSLGIFIKPSTIPVNKVSSPTYSHNIQSQGLVVNKDFQEWFNEKLKSLNASDNSSLIEVCLSLDQPTEIKQVLLDAIGNSHQTLNFFEDIITYKNTGKIPTDLNGFQVSSRKKRTAK